MLRDFVTVLRVGVVATVYVVTSLVGALVGTAGAPGGAPLKEYLVSALIGGAILPLALTIGWLLWLVPAVLRAAMDGDPEPRLIPEQWDAPLLLVPTVTVALACSSIVPDADLSRLVVCTSFAGLAVSSVAAILVSGGRHVALLWLRLVT